MRKLGIAGLFGAFALLTAGAAQATAVTTFNADLANPASSGSDPNFYNGSGNPNGGFVVTTNNGIELGLRAKHRQDPNTLAPIGLTGNDGHIYSVPTGSQSATVTDRAWWNYEFSIDLRPNGVGSLTLADVLPYSTMTVIDNTQGQQQTVSLGSTWLDDSTWGPTGEDPSGLFGAGVDWGLQNSENPTFGDFPLASLYDMNANDFFTFILNVKNAAGDILATDWMGVRVGNADIPTSPTPEPLTLALFGAGLAGLGLMRRKGIFTT